MAVSFFIYLNDPGANTISKVTLNETSRTQVTAQQRSREIIFQAITEYPNDLDISMHNSMSVLDIQTIATAAAQDLKNAGYIP